MLKGSKVLKFLKETGLDIARVGLDIADDFFPPLEGITKLLNRNNVNLNPEQEAKLKELYLEEKALHNADRASARNLQSDALSQKDKFSKRFIYYLAAFWSIASVAYIFCATFLNIENVSVANTVLGFILGTIVATIINFFYGTSETSNDNQNLINIGGKK